MSNEGIVFQASHELRDVGWAEDPKEVSFKDPGKEDSRHLLSRMSGRAGIVWLGLVAP